LVCLALLAGCAFRQGLEPSPLFDVIWQRLEAGRKVSVALACAVKTEASVLKDLGKNGPEWEKSVCEERSGKIEQALLQSFGKEPGFALVEGPPVDRLLAEAEFPDKGTLPQAARRGLGDKGISELLVIEVSVERSRRRQALSLIDVEKGAVLASETSSDVR